MSKQWQIRRGTSAENNEFTGAQGELTMDTDTNALRIHDGTTQGGHMIDSVVEWQAPTAENNYTWYRKYSSGWVEQGGLAQAAAGGWSYVDLLIEMANTSATVNVSVNWATTEQDGLKVPSYYMPSTTRIGILIHGRTGQTGIAYYSGQMSWQVSGMAA